MAWNEIRIVNGKKKGHTMATKKKNTKLARPAPAKVSAKKRKPNPGHERTTNAAPKKRKNKASTAAAAPKAAARARHMRKPNPGRMMQKEGGTILLFGGVGMVSGLVGGQMLNRITPTWSNFARSGLKGGLAVSAMLAALYWKPMQSVEAMSGAAGLSFGLGASVLLDQFADKLGLIPAPQDVPPEEMAGPDEDEDEDDDIDGADFDAMVRASMGGVPDMQGLGDARPANMQGLGDARPANMQGVPDMQGRAGMGDLVATVRVPVGSGADNNSMQGYPRPVRRAGMGAPAN